MIFKRIKLNFYKTYLSLIINVTTLRLVSLGRRNSLVKIFYGGARTGNLGGPLVKVYRLNKLFPESKFDFNLLYCLSNTPYLNQKSFKKIKSHKIPIILNQNGVFYKGWYPKGWREKNIEMSTAYHIADYVFWQSEFSKSTADIFLGKRQGPGEILFNAVDLNIFKPKKQNLILTSKVNFLIMGKFSSDKYYAIEPALIALKNNLLLGYNFHLSIAGYMDSALKKKTIELIDKLGIKSSVNLIGQYNQVEAPLIYRNSHVLIHLKYLDPCPNVVIEAMASGLPVIYSDSGGTAELVTGIAGSSIKTTINFEEPPIAANPLLITHAMIDILDSYDMRSKFSRDLAEKNFNLNSWHKRHANVFEYYIDFLEKN